MDMFAKIDVLNTRTLLIGIVVFLALFRFLRRPRNLPPGPWGWPILGNLPQMMSSEGTMFEFFSKLTKRYGNIIHVKGGGISIVFLHGHNTVKEAFSQHQLSGRPEPHITYKICPHGIGILDSSGEQWVEIRRFCMTVLRGLGVGKSSFEQTISTEADILMEEIGKQNGKAFDPKHALGNAVSNIICSVVFGKRFQYNDPEFQRLLKVLSDNVVEAGSGGMIEMSPVFYKLRMLPFVRRYIHAVENFFNHIYRLVGEHTHEKDNDNPRDFIDIFLNEKEKKDKQGIESLALQSENLPRIVGDLFAAGSETTATTLRWAMLYMMAYPEVQTRVQKELDDATSRNRMPRIADKPELPYTEAVLSEVQRIGTILPVSVPHMCSEDTKLMGYNIPKGTLVISNLWHNHFDPSVWAKPKSFRPERFLDKEGQFQSREVLTPFGVGRRICIGEHLARQELFVLFTHLLHHFTLKNPNKATPVSFEGNDGIVWSPQDFTVCAIARN
ncbi:cytochrome P450 2J6-like [Patiria miniata]|uniref:Cytochrome P450 n=1 Tax=Patiria miniata TaxID=46514 RepID=A0A914BML7_PATMI|nr:cytochrome P450 2J6-like [Patiria miniata]XP_038077533.1 cytochrome P450 2J6-like [Patiria miniata]XP_038077534.1 cytochrome P450 2J6-like [Patiria miniata]